MKDNYIIYQLTCSVSGKRYIGYTKNFRTRLRQHCRSDYLIGSAIRKYGLSNFRIAVLYSRIPLETAWVLEKRLIVSQATLVPLGYNMIEGRMGANAGYWKGKKLSAEHRRKISENSGNRKPEVRAKMSETRRGKDNPMYGRKHSVETKQKISENNATKRPEVREKISKSRRGKLHPFYGKSHTLETKRKMSQNNAMKNPEHRMKLSESKKRYYAKQKHNPNQLTLFD